MRNQLIAKNNNKETQSFTAWDNAWFLQSFTCNISELTGWGKFHLHVTSSVSTVWIQFQLFHLTLFSSVQLTYFLVSSKHSARCGACTAKKPSSWSSKGSPYIPTMALNCCVDMACPSPWLPSRREIRERKKIRIKLHTVKGHKSAHSHDKSHTKCTGRHTNTVTGAGWTQKGDSVQVKE